MTTAHSLMKIADYVKLISFPFIFIIIIIIIIINGSITLWLVLDRFFSFLTINTVGPA
jgi:hypothetical protein